MYALGSATLQKYIYTQIASGLLLSHNCLLPSRLVRIKLELHVILLIRFSRVPGMIFALTRLPSSPLVLLSGLEGLPLEVCIFRPHHSASCFPWTGPGLCIISTMWRRCQSCEHLCLVQHTSSLCNLSRRPRTTNRLHGVSTGHKDDNFALLRVSGFVPHLQ